MASSDDDRLRSVPRLLAHRNALLDEPLGEEDLADAAEEALGRLVGEGLLEAEEGAWQDAVDRRSRAELIAELRRAGRTAAGPGVAPSPDPAALVRAVAAAATRHNRGFNVTFVKCPTVGQPATRLLLLLLFVS